MLDPALAQHTRAVRTRGFFSSKDIATVRDVAAAAATAATVANASANATAAATTPSAAAAAQVAAEEKDCEAPVYLQRGGLSASLVPLVDRIFAHACRVDAEQGWGMVASGDVQAAGNNVHARCVEFHEYGAGRRRRCGCHYDSGSLWTVDIMLSDTGSFEGGELVTTVRTPLEGAAVPAAAGGSAAHDEFAVREAPSAAEGGEGGGVLADEAALFDYAVTPVPMEGAVTAAHEKQAFEQGDCLVFLSHKWHSVAPLLSGVRNVLVLEFWEGPTCVLDHRCMGFPPCGDRIRHH